MVKPTEWPRLLFVDEPVGPIVSGDPGPQAAPYTEVARLKLHLVVQLEEAAASKTNLLVP